MFVTLDVPSFQCVEGYSRVAAAVDEPGVMQVEVFGTENCIREINADLLQGQTDAELDGRPIRIRQFLVLNQGDPRRIAMTVRFDERSQFSHHGEPLQRR
ncbi:MAG: hypothetical protein DI587_18495 [Variovorax paradoxus]|nr:MAG: hypothetical protein DI583_18495 [Variovorax paradoxus]PZQ08456.1 MAG: hypothetical protein DI587_18495 [Variovorax paradoxus]